MAETFDILAQGIITTSLVTVYTGPAAGAVIRHIALVNYDPTDPVDVLIKLNGVTDDYLWLPERTMYPGDGLYFNGALSLGVGDTLRVIASDATRANYLISGVGLT